MPYINEQPAFVCNTCGKPFATKSGMSKHEKKIHGRAEDLLDCQLCDKKFVNTSSLRMHMTNHTDSRPHVCSVCDKSYKHKETLIKHKLAHHPGLS